MTILNLIDRYRSCKYTGANSTELLSLVNETTGTDPYFSASVTFADSSQCAITFRDSSNNFTDVTVVHTGGNIIVQGKQMAGTDMPDSYIASMARTYDESMALLAASPSFASAMAAAGGAFGVMPNITVNGLSNANFDITIRPSMANTSYTAIPALTGSASLLGSLSITNVTNGLLNNAGKLSASQVRVNVANSGALQLVGASILVHVTP